MTVASDLRALGWNVPSRPWTSTRERLAIKAFQRGWALGAPLSADGVAGAKTKAALAISNKARAAGRPTASKYFSFNEFRCKCGGTYSGCQVIYVLRPLLLALDAYRVKYGPTSIRSGYRCPTHNRIVGGATNSQHMYGAAVDVEYHAMDRSVAAMHKFSGIGRSHRTHMVRHVDVRHLSGHNTTGGSPSSPTIWDYAS